MNIKSSLYLLLIPATVLFSCADNKKPDTANADTQKDSVMITEEAVSYKDDTTTLNGYVAYNAKTENKRPVVLVVHEWWGLNDYPRMRAKQLAELGYIAMAVDMFGGGKQGNDPASAGALSMPFYNNPQLIKSRLDAAMAKIKTYAQADTSKMAAIGYCFGGSMVLNYAKMGAGLEGVVSFHGDLRGVPPKKELLKSEILVCHGAADQFVPQAQVNAFKKSMDSIGAKYTFKIYSNATHAFTNPQATETGKKFNLPIEYNAAADKQSWNDMKEFLGRILR